RIRDLGPRLLSWPDVAAQTEIVDLREVVDVVSLRKKDRAEATGYLMPQPSERAWRGYPFRGHVLQLFVPKGPAHVVVLVRDQPPVELRNVRGEVLVEPGTWPEVEIV